MREITEVFCDCSIVVTEYKIGELYLHLFGTNCFHAKERIKQLLLKARLFVGTSNMKISRRRLQDYDNKLH